MSSDNKRFMQCPECCHDKFLVTAHVTETWLVDQYGDFIAVLKTNDEQVIKRPNIQSRDFQFTCAQCGAEPDLLK